MGRTRAGTWSADTGRGIAVLNRWARAEVAASGLDSGSKRRDRTKRAAGCAERGDPSSLDQGQAKDLFSRVDKILSFVSTDTGLPIVHNVKRKLITREEVNKYLNRKFEEDAGAKRLAREEIVLKKFGLLDRDFHLRPFMISLLTEQVAGFYDDKTKTVNLLDWIEPDEQEPVLAHELTHALQARRSV